MLSPGSFADGRIENCTFEVRSSRTAEPAALPDMKEVIRGCISESRSTPCFLSVPGRDNETHELHRVASPLAEVLDGVTNDREEVVVTRAGHEPVVIVSLAGPLMDDVKSVSMAKLYPTSDTETVALQEGDR